MTSFVFKKRYGQNFLKDENIIRKITSSINPSEKDLIIEIGPGSGALTKYLIGYNSSIIAFEIDKDTKTFLEPLVSDKCKIVYEDFLDTNINQYLKMCEYEKIYIIGNLPYYITTAIIEKIINSGINAESITIMIQKEVADRFLAKPHTKDYGYMTVLLNFYYNIKKVIEVKRTCFHPQPNVDSTVVQLIRKAHPSIDALCFDKLIKEAFQFKRKKILNNITSISKDKIRYILEKNGYNEDARSEELDLSTFVELAKCLEK